MQDPLKDRLHEPMKNLERQNIETECEDKELTSLSFWNEPQKDYMPDWENFHDRFDYFKILSIVVILFLLIICFYLGYKLWKQSEPETVIVAPAPVEAPSVVIEAPIVPAKIPVETVEPEQESLIYKRLETDNIDAYKVKKKPSKKKTVKKVVVKASESDNYMTYAPSPTETAAESYYIFIDTFNHQEEAIRRYHELKSNNPLNMKNLNPLVRILPTDTGDKYELLVGPIDRSGGLSKCQIFGGKSKLIGAAD